MTYFEPSPMVCINDYLIDVMSVVIFSILIISAVLKCIALDVVIMNGIIWMYMMMTFLSSLGLENTFTVDWLLSSIQVLDIARLTWIEHNMSF